MKRSDLIQNKILTTEEAVRQVNRWKLSGKKFAFTNGVFDILHKGHLFSLSQAAAEADYLIVGLNADASVKRLKGESRPVNDQGARALILASLIMVDVVVTFEQDTPLELICMLMPDVLVKGGDYTIEQIAGAKEVMGNGGRVVINTLVEGYSTTNIIQRSSRVT